MSRTEVKISKDHGKFREKDSFKHNDEEKNPCLAEQKLSLKCLSENYKEKDKCVLFFENFKKCKSFWNEIKLNRSRKGISPMLPPTEERKRIKEEYLRTHDYY